MRRISLVASIVILASSMTGCATTKGTLTDLQRSAMKSRVMEGSRDDVFRSTTAVLQDKGYAVKESDAGSGTLCAQTGRLPLGFGSEVYTATFRFEAIAEKKVKIRLSISRAVFDAAGREAPCFPLVDNEFVMGTPVHRAGVVEDPDMYQDFYEEIGKKMTRGSQPAR